jgi:predicted GNAT family acetyltransferase
VAVNDGVEVVDDPGGRRWVVQVDGQDAGFVTYRVSGGRMTLLHTEIDDAFEGRGLGGQLARGVLEGARERQLKVVPRCPFIAGWIRRHPEWMDVVDPAARDLVSD